MSNGELLQIDPVELQFPCKKLLEYFLLFRSICCSLCLFVFFLIVMLKIVELKKQISCSLQLSNKSDDYVAFKVSWEFTVITFFNLFLRLQFYFTFWISGEDDESKEVLCKAQYWNCDASFYLWYHRSFSLSHSFPYNKYALLDLFTLLNYLFSFYNWPWELYTIFWGKKFTLFKN